MKLSATATFVERNSVGQFIASRVTPALMERMDKAGALVAAEAKSLAPVHTGELRDSISHRVDAVGSRVVATIYASAPHAGFVEYGTGQRGASSASAGPYPYSASWPGMAAQPFLRPALDTMRGEIKGVITSGALLTT